MGIRKLPSIKDYWSQHVLLGVLGITRGMPQKRFLSILSHLHLNDSSKIPTRDSLLFHKLYKVRPLLSRILENSQTNYYSHQQLAVDEAMILFKGRSTLKQYMPLKPCRRGTNHGVCVTHTTATCTTSIFMWINQWLAVMRIGLGLEL